MVRAPAAWARLRVLSVLNESTTSTSSAQATLAQHATIFAASFFVIMIADIGIGPFDVDLLTPPPRVQRAATAPAAYAGWPYQAVAPVSSLAPAPGLTWALTCRSSAAWPSGVPISMNEPSSGTPNSPAPAATSAGNGPYS